MSVSRRVELSVGLRNFARAGEGSGLVEDLVARTVALDDLGVDRVVVSDHVVFGSDLSDYGDPSVGGLRGGVQPTGPDGDWLEPLTLAAFLAAGTERIRLSTGIIVAGLRRPVVLAKTVATLDRLSRGRIDLGVGVGWQRAEYEAAGLEFSDRGALLDGTLRTCVELWTGEAVELSGASGPVVVQSRPAPFHGSVPIWVSGSVSGPVVRRTARFGVGWIPWGRALDEPEAGLRSFRSALATELEAAEVEGWVTPLTAAGDLRAAASIRVPPPDRTTARASTVRSSLQRVPALVAAGFDDLRLSVAPSAVPFVETVAEVLAQLDGVVDR